MTKTLTIDIETAPNVADVWSLWNQNVGITQLAEPTRMISFAAKWLGRRGIEFRSEFHDGQEAMVSRAYELLDKADVVVHYNGERFDVPHLNREFLLAGLSRPAPFQQVDLLKAVRKQFQFPSYKLAYVTATLGLTGKLSHEGHTLWVRCIREQDPAAWRIMRRYNKQDVKTTEELYERLRSGGWISALPNLSMIDGKTDGCPNCGSTDLESRGFHYTKAAAYRRYHCRNCGRWSHHRKSESVSDMRVIA